LISEYIRFFNKYWYSSYQAKYATFGKKSPIQIAKQDIPNLREDLIEKYFVAYDIDSAFNMKRLSEYLALLKSSIYYNEEIVGNQGKKINIFDDNMYHKIVNGAMSTGQI